MRTAKASVLTRVVPLAGSVGIRWRSRCCSQQAGSRAPRLPGCEPLGFGHPGHDPAIDAETVGLLEARQGARRSRGLEPATAENGTCVPAGLDLVVEKLVATSRAAPDLRDHLVSAPIHGEAVDVIAGEQDSQLSTDLGEIEPEIGPPARDRSRAGPVAGRL